MDKVYTDGSRLAKHFTATPRLGARLDCPCANVCRHARDDAAVDRFPRHASVPVGGDALSALAVVVAALLRVQSVHQSHEAFNKEHLVPIEFEGASVDGLNEKDGVSIPPRLPARPGQSAPR